MMQRVHVQGVKTVDKERTRNEDNVENHCNCEKTNKRRIDIYEK